MDRRCCDDSVSGEKFRPSLRRPRQWTQVRDEVKCWGSPVHSNSVSLSCWVYYSGQVWKWAVVIPLPPQIRLKSILIPTFKLQKAFADRVRNDDWVQWVTWVLWKELETRNVRNCQYYIKIYYIYLQTIYYFWQTYNAFTDKIFKYVLGLLGMAKSA